MLVARRSAEKHAAGRIPSLAMAWLQQAAAMPFILVTFLFARFYWPGELSHGFWVNMFIYVTFVSIDAYCYFKALSIADVSYVAPLMSLTAIGSIVGAYFILDQVPTVHGMFGAVLIVAGAIITYNAKRKDSANHHNNKRALLLIGIIVLMRTIAASIEVIMLRESNPATFNFYSSALAIPLIFVCSLLIIYTSRSSKYKNYWRQVGKSVMIHKKLLLFIGLTYTINMLATYQGKLLSPDAGYVTAVKSAQVLPMMLIGAIVFKEKILTIQWVGLGLISAGLVLLAIH